MRLRQLPRLAMHLLVIIAMITATLVVPAQAATDVLQTAVASQMAAAMDDMPCGEMGTPAVHDEPCDCCTAATCDLSACLGTACLPELPRLVMGIPATTVQVQRNAPAPPSRLIDTPLRPPIA